MDSLRIRRSRLVFTVAALAVWFMTGRAQAQMKDGCEMAGTRVRVESEGSGGAGQAVRYTVINNRRESLSWVRISSGANWHSEALALQRPDIVSSPGGWRGTVVSPEVADQFHMLWEATSATSVLRPQSRTAFGIEANGHKTIPRGQVGADGQPVRPIVFTILPFTAGGDGGCWWGWTDPAGGPLPVGGTAAITTVAAVRSFAGAGRDYVIVDAPAYETHMRLSDGVYLTVPITFSWGVKGGFSHNASIGLGLRWSPVEYVSLYAQTHVGTFFFTNRTHLRHVGVDVNIPRYSTSSASGTVSRDEYFVFGVEYFDRRAVKGAGYMDGPQWYASGHGVAIRFGIRAVAWDR
jgi:hypothetical protein